MLRLALLPILRDLPPSARRHLRVLAPYLVSVAHLEETPHRQAKEAEAVPIGLITSTVRRIKGQKSRMTATLTRNREAKKLDRS